MKVMRMNWLHNRREWHFSDLLDVLFLFFCKQIFSRLQFNTFFYDKLWNFFISLICAETFSTPLHDIVRFSFIKTS